MTIAGIIVDVILFFIVAGNAVIGYRRGLVNVIFNIFATLIAFILVLIFYKPTTNYMMNHTNVAQKIESMCEEKLGALLENSNEENNTPKENESMSILSLYIGDEMGNLVQDTTDTVIKSVSNNITQKIISVLVFFILFAIIRLLLYILRNYMNLVGNLPIVRLFNGSGGMIYGVIKGFLIIYATFAILSIILPIISGNFIITAIEQAQIGSKMFHNNILLNVIFRFL